MTQTSVQVIVRPDNSVGTKTAEIRSPGRGEVLVESVCTLISAGTELGTQEQDGQTILRPGTQTRGALSKSVKGWTAIRSETVCCRWEATQVT